MILGLLRRFIGIVCEMVSSTGSTSIKKGRDHAGDVSEARRRKWSPLSSWKSHISPLARHDLEQRPIPTNTSHIF